jgi:predicted RNA-binding protein with PUA-like domain
VPTPPYRRWLVKSEPDSFSVDDLASAPEKTTCWDGVRNYTARNFMRDQMKLGQLVLFYHSSTEPSGVVGVAEVVREGYPDSSAWDRKSKYHDPDIAPGDPRWSMVDLRLVEKFKDIVTLAELKARTDLDGMELLKRGSRLSVQPVGDQHFEIVVGMGRAKGRGTR